MDRSACRVRVWDTTSRSAVLELKEPSYFYRARWLPGDKLLVAGISGIWAVDLQGNSRRLVELPPTVNARDEVATLGFDRNGKLLTHGRRSHIHTWDSPARSRTHGGFYGPSILDYEPGWAVTLGDWPARAQRVPT
jgi:hypothetical protein